MRKLLDPRERHFQIPSWRPGLSLFARQLAPPEHLPKRGTVLYVHGATFPSALSIAHRFDGRSWRDELCAAGFDVWAFDFHGFGGSDAYPEMTEPAEEREPLCRSDDASRQIEEVVHFICHTHAAPRISLIAHSWGTIATGCFAARCPELVDRLVVFGPIARRTSQQDPPRYPAWRLVSLQDQWDRFTAEVPPGATPVLACRHFEPWGEAYLDSDSASRSRSPASVKTPSGPWHDIAQAWTGDLGYDPALVRAPVMLIRGEWDSMCADADAAWLFNAFAASPIRRDVKISRATHLMHLEASRYALYREAEAFLLARDMPTDHAS